MDIPPVGLTALTWGLFMGASSNVRYQIVFGLERLVDATVAKCVYTTEFAPDLATIRTCGPSCRCGSVGPSSALLDLASLCAYTPKLHVAHVNAASWARLRDMCRLQPGVRCRRVPRVAYATSFGLRFINNVIGGENFIDMARWAGIQ